MARQVGSDRKRSAGRTARCACCAARLLPRNCEVDQSETIGSRLLQTDATPNASTPQGFPQAETSFPQGGKTRSKCEAASSTSARLSRNPTWQMLAEARFIVDICVEDSSDSGSSSLVGHFQEATKLPVSDTLLRL